MLIEYEGGFIIDLDIDKTDVICYRIQKPPTLTILIITQLYQITVLHTGKRIHIHNLKCGEMKMVDCKTLLKSKQQYRIQNN